MRGLTLLSLATAAFAAIRQKDLATEFDGHVDGFHLRSLFTTKGGLTQYNIKPSERAQREAEALALPDVDVSVPSKARTTICAKLALILLCHCPALAQEEAERVAAAGDGLWSADDIAQDRSLMIEMMTAVTDEIGDEESEFKEKVYAGLWVSPGGTSILTFLKSDIDDDVAAITQSVWFYIDKTKEMMKNTWVNVAGLPWGQEQQATEALNASLYYNVVYNEQETALSAMSGLLASQGTYVGNATDAFNVANLALQNVSNASQFMMTGWMAGGSRAAAASISFKTRMGLSVPTITFASTGSACWNERMNNGGSFPASEYDPSREQPQITEYVHPLSMFGHSVGVDVGNECYIGLDESSKVPLETAQKWCAPLYGNDGTRLLYAYAAPSLQLYEAYLPDIVRAALPGFLTPLSEDDTKLASHHRECQYFTEIPASMYVQVISELNDDGTTKSGCHVNRPVGAGDLRCPMNRGAPASDDDDFASSAGAIVLYVVAGLAFVVVLLLIGRWALSKPQVEPANEKNYPNA